VNPQSDDALAREERALDQLGSGERGVIVRLAGEPEISRRLMELGLVPGTPVTVVRRAPLGDPIELTARGVHLSLRRTEAKHIHVTPR
jgi:Fe2+ transport system protein FeoA